MKPQRYRWTANFSKVAHVFTPCCAAKFRTACCCKVQYPEMTCRRWEPDGWGREGGGAAERRGEEGNTSREGETAGDSRRARREKDADDSQPVELC